MCNLQIPTYDSGYAGMSNVKKVLKTHFEGIFINSKVSYLCKTDFIILIRVI